MTTTIIKKIFALKLSALLNGEHFNFMKFVATAIGMFEIIGEKFAEGVEVFMSAFEREDEVYQKYDRKRATKLINDAENERDEKFRILRDSIKIAQRMSDAAVSEAADILMGVIDLYGGSKILAMGMNEKSGVLTNLIQDFEDKQIAQVTKLNAGILLTELKTANDKFIRLVSDRTLADSEIGKAAMRDARTTCDDAYRALIDSINLEVFYGRGAQLAPFNNYMNTEIDRYRILTGQGVVGGSSSGGTSSGGGSSSGDGTGSGGTETPVVMKNATFNKIDGTATIVPFAVGAPIEYPENTVGYKWKPLLEFMPKTNKTFNEVPVIDVESLAIFHFADHRDEEIRQIVGTILHAPANTLGYYWEPTVPELMPAEDSAYYEMPFEGDGGEGSGGDNNEEENLVDADFYYLDNTEYNLKGKPGTRLIAPEPDPGNYWEPTPPMYFPDHDTEYHEVEGSDEGDGDDDAGFGR